MYVARLCFVKQNIYTIIYAYSDQTEMATSSPTRSRECKYTHLMYV